MGMEIGMGVAVDVGVGSIDNKHSYVSTSASLLIAPSYLKLDRRPRELTTPL